MWVCSLYALNHWGTAIVAHPNRELQTNARLSWCFPERSRFAKGALGTQRCGLVLEGVKIKLGFEPTSPSPHALPASWDTPAPPLSAPACRDEDPCAGMAPAPLSTHRDAPLPTQSSRCRNKSWRWVSPYHRLLLGNLLLFVKDNVIIIIPLKKKSKKKRKWHLSIFKKENVFFPVGINGSINPKGSLMCMFFALKESWLILTRKLDFSLAGLTIKAHKLTQSHPDMVSVGRESWQRSIFWTPHTSFLRVGDPDPFFGVRKSGVFTWCKSAQLSQNRCQASGLRWGRLQHVIYK